jgi:hypothetical protein
MTMQRSNDEKFINHTCAKTQRDWDKLIIVVE